MPPEHKGFELGGRSGNIVVRVLGGEHCRVLVETGEADDMTVVIEKGWKAVACNYMSMDGQQVKKALNAARRGWRECRVTFELTSESATRMGKRILRQSAARLKLQEMLGNRSLAQLEAMDKSVKGDYMKDLKVQVLLMDARAIHETEVLLGEKVAHVLQLARDIVTALRRGKHRDLEHLLTRPGAAQALMQRDGGGNVPLHHARDAQSAMLLAKLEPRAKEVKNLRGRLPLHTFAQQATSAEAFGTEDALRTLASDAGAFLDLDEDGLCPAMLLQGNQGPQSTKDLVCSWRETARALRKTPGLEALAALKELQPPGRWRDIVYFHCFSEPEVWREGKHTNASKARLGVVWETLRMAMAEVSARQESGLELAKGLLAATKGPKQPGLDPRQPFRVELLQTVKEMEVSTGNLMAELYGKLPCNTDTEWLLSMPSSLNPDTSSQLCKKLGIAPRLQMRVEPPEWLVSGDTKQAFDDLLRLGLVGKTERRDAAYDLLCLAGVATQAEDNLVLARWFGAWLRGVCQQQQGTLYEAVRKSFSILAQQEGSFTTRKEAKSFERIWEKMREQMREFALELEQLGLGQVAAAAPPAGDAPADPSQAPGRRESDSFGEEESGSEGSAPNCAEDLLEGARRRSTAIGGLRRMTAAALAPEPGRRATLQQRRSTARRSTALIAAAAGEAEEEEEETRPMDALTREAAGFICDINGCTFVADTVFEIRNALKRLQCCGLTIARIKNGFSKDHSPMASANYRDLKVWVECTSEQGPMLVEVQFLLRAFYKEKKWMHLAYEVRRGSFDWPHVHEISGAMAREDAAAALEVAIAGGKVMELRVAMFTAIITGVAPEQIELAKKRAAEVTRAWRSQLSRAMQERDHRSLARAIARSDEYVGVDDRQLLEGKGLLAQLQQQCKAAGQQLAAALQSRSGPALLKAIADAEELFYEGPELFPATEVLAEVQGEARDVLAAAVKAAKFRPLLSAVQQARDSGLEDWELEQAEELLAGLRSSALETLNQAMTGEDAQHLIEAIDDAQLAEVDLGVIVKAERALMKLRSEVRAALQAATTGKQYDVLKAAILRARRALLPDVEIATAEKVFEKVAEMLREARKQIADAIRDRALEALAAAVRYARRAGLDEEEIRPAEQVQTDVQREQSDALLHLRRLVMSRINDVDKLVQAIEHAKGLRLPASTREIASAEAYLQELQQVRLGAEEQLQRGMDARRAPIILGALEQCYRSGLGEDHLLVQVARELLLELREEALEAIEAAIQSRDPRRLIAAIEQARRAAFDGDEAKQARMLLEEIHGPVRTRLLSAMQQTNCDELRAAIQAAKDVALEGSELQKAEDQLLTLQREKRAAMAGPWAEAREMLENAINSRSLTLLPVAIQNARKVGLEPKEIEEAEQCLARFLKQIQDARLALKKAMDSKSAEGIKTAIEQARAVGIDEAELDNAKMLANQISGTNTALRRAMEGKDATRLGEAVRKARLVAGDNKLVNVAVHLLSDLHRSEALQNLKESVEARNGPRLCDAIRKCQQVGVAKKDLEEAQTVMSELQTEARENVKRNLAGKKDPDALAAAIIHARGCGIASSELRMAEEMLEHLREVVSQPLQFLQLAIESRSVAMLPNAISLARQAGVAPEEIQVAEKLLKELSREREAIQDWVQAALLKAADCDDAQELQQVLRDARLAGCDEAMLRETKAKVADLRTQSAKQALAKACEARSRDALSLAIDQALRAGMGEKEIGPAKLLLSELRFHDVKDLLKDAQEKRERKSKVTLPSWLPEAIDAARGAGVDRDEVDGAERILTQLLKSSVR